MNISHVKSMKLTYILCVRYNFWRFSSFFVSLLVRHRYSCQKTKWRLHTPISTVVHAEVVCTPKILPIGFFLDHTLRSKIIAPSIPKLSGNFAENELFLLAFPSSLRSNYALNEQTGHGRGRDLDTRSIFSPPLDHGRNRSVQPWLRLLTWITVMVNQALNNRNRQRL